MKNKYNVKLFNLGCKVNYYEIEAIKGELINSGFNISGEGEIFDIAVINTCTVTNIADRKSRQLINKVRKENKDAIILVTGCYAQLIKEDKILKDKSVDIFVGNEKKDEIPSILIKYINGDKNKNYVTCLEKNLSYEKLKINNTIDKARAFVKIEDGCNDYCSYCAIPMARGFVRSKNKEDIICEINSLIEKGYKEIVLTGINISSYGIDIDSSLSDLIFTLVNSIDNKIRLRFSSLEPRIINKELLDILKSYPNFCPHFHLSLQSGCDKILKKMNRKYTTKDYESKVNLIRKYWEYVSITTDIIVGFPGETEEDFNKTYEYVDKIDFFATHIFKYSKRDNTPASVMTSQVEETIKKDRSHKLLNLNNLKKEKFIKSYIGNELEVLIENIKKINNTNYYFGYSKEYIPVLISDNSLKENDIIKITGHEFIKNNNDMYLIGK